MARRNTKALEKTQDIEKKIQELMQQKEELRFRCELEAKRDIQ